VKAEAKELEGRGRGTPKNTSNLLLILVLYSHAVQARHISQSQSQLVVLCNVRILLYLVVPLRDGGITVSKCKCEGTLQLQYYVLVLRIARILHRACVIGLYGYSTVRVLYSTIGPYSRFR
jgi:hypothetical protein